MVKLGFIVEGETEKIVLQSSKFKDFLQSQNIDFIDEIIDGEGGNLLSEIHLNAFIEILKDKGANHILLLTDLEDSVCYTSKKTMLDLCKIDSVVISKKKFEAWFLAHHDALRKIIEDENYSCEFPENIEVPYNEIKNLRMKNNPKSLGVGDKLKLARRMIRADFEIQEAAKHPNCPSAKYFIDKLSSISKT